MANNTGAKRTGLFGIRQRVLAWYKYWSRTHPTNRARIDALKAYRQAHFRSDFTTSLKTQCAILCKIMAYNRDDEKVQEICGSVAECTVAPVPLI